MTKDRRGSTNGESNNRAVDDANHRKAKNSLDTLYEISQILGTGIDKRTLTLCVTLCEQGVPPENVAVCFYSYVYSLLYLANSN